MSKSRSLCSPFLKSCAKAYTCQWELHHLCSPKGRELVSSHWATRMGEHKPIAARQLYLPKKVAMTVAFMVSKSKSGCFAKEHWKGKEESIRLHLEVLQVTLEWWGKRDYALFFNLSQSSHAASSYYFLGQLISSEEVMFGLSHSHRLIFYSSPKFLFCSRKPRFHSPT